MKYTVEHARKCLSVIDAGLIVGLGQPEPGEMCVEAAICYALGLPHGDDPGCISAAVRSFKISLNDKRWSSDTARAAGLRALAVAQLGSKGVIDDRVFVQRLTEQIIRVIVPIALRASARRVPSHALALETAAVACEREGTREAALAARDAADAADAAIAAADAAADAVCAAAYAAAYAAYAADAAVADAYAADAVADAADAVADAYAADAVADAVADAAYADAAYADADAVADAADAVADAAYADTRDAVLAKAASLAFDVLREMGTPGVALWDAVNAE
jgi:hypothetical protein